MQLVKTWTLDHVNADPEVVLAGNRFTIPESGAIGISCQERPSLSVMYLGTNQAPVILSDHTNYRSATFLKISGKEYLAAACDEDGCLYLWDIETQTSKRAFDPELPKDEPYKYMNIFKIKDTTIGYGEVFQSSDESQKVFILKTDTNELTLYSTLRLFTPHDIWDMCYTEMDGGTACLLLCIPRAHRIMAVEMIGGQTRWEVGKEQMGKTLKPWSICTDQAGCAYVADYDQKKIHLLSASDGTVIKQFDCRNYGIYNVFTVRFHDQHLWVEYKIHEKAIDKRKYTITKFKPFQEM